MQKIVFATGLHDDEGPAAATAAALASATGAKLFAVHAATGDATQEAARAEEVAARWGRPIEGQLVLHTCCEDPTDTLLDAIARIAPELLVVGTHGRGEIAHLFSGSVAESVARNVPVPTLFVPLHGAGLASSTSGGIELRRVIVPAGDASAKRVGLEAAAWLSRAVGASGVEVILLHVDDGRPSPAEGDEPAGLSVSRVRAEGKLEDAIGDLSTSSRACAIVMATRGHDGVLDALTGSHTEHVVRKVACPLLSVPIPA